MIEKCNKIYSIFDEDIIVTDNIKFNAIQGYDIVDICNVGGVEDILQWSERADKKPCDILSYQIYRFINPANGCEWYITDHFIASKGSSNYYEYPVIRAFFYNNTAIVEGFDTLLTYKRFLSECTDIKRVARVGYLSTPHKAVVNYQNKDLTKIKLPYVI